jgi:hypothetical protein
MLQTGDALIVIGHRDAIPEFADRYEFQRKHLKVRRDSLPPVL